MDKDCKVIQIITPKNYILNGLWFGPEKAKRAFIFVHGLSSTAWKEYQTVSKIKDWL